MAGSDNGGNPGASRHPVRPVGSGNSVLSVSNKEFDVGSLTTP